MGLYTCVDCDYVFVGPSQRRRCDTCRSTHLTKMWKRDRENRKERQRDQHRDRYQERRKEFIDENVTRRDDE